MIKIGDFSALTHISVKTLRYYDETGLLPPYRVDSETGYRYYSTTQLPRLYKILALKDLGFSLEQISRMLAEDINTEKMRGMLLLRQAEQENRVQQEQERLTRVRGMLRLIEKENEMNRDVVLKQVAPQWIASVRKIIPTYPDVGQLYPAIFAALGTNFEGGLPVALWHDKEYKEKEVDAEAGLYLKRAVPVGDGVQVHELPAATVASMIHHGAYNRLPESYDTVLHWIEANQFRVAGPIREIYLHCSTPVRQDDESYVTEIQVPVQSVC